MSGTVEQLYDIDASLLERLASNSGYWQKCADFYKDVAERNAASLSEKQKGWLEKIEAQLIEESLK